MTTGTVSNGRKPTRAGNGRFLVGNPGGPGNPRLRRLAAAQDAVRRATRPADVRAVLDKLRDLALAGDTTAARLWLDRTLGRVESLPVELLPGSAPLPPTPPGPPVPNDGDLAEQLEQMAAAARELAARRALLDCDGAAELRPLPRMPA